MPFFQPPKVGIKPDEDLTVLDTEDENHNRGQKRYFPPSLDRDSGGGPRSATASPGGSARPISDADKDADARSNNARGQQPVAGIYAACKLHPDSIKELVAYTAANKIPNPVAPSDLHITTVYSRKPFTYEDAGNIDPPSMAHPTHASFLPPDSRSLVMFLDSDFLHTRWNKAMACGASWDYPSYKPHVTLSYDVGQDFDPNTLTPFSAPLMINAEYQESLDEGWADDQKDKEESASLYWELGERALNRHNASSMQDMHSIRTVLTKLGAKDLSDFDSLDSGYLAYLASRDFENPSYHEQINRELKALGCNFRATSGKFDELRGQTVLTFIEVMPD